MCIRCIYTLILAALGAKLRDLGTFCGVFLISTYILTCSLGTIKYYKILYNTI